MVARSGSFCGGRSTAHRRAEVSTRGRRSLCRRPLTRRRAADREQTQRDVAFLLIASQIARGRAIRREQMQSQPQNQRECCAVVARSGASSSACVSPSARTHRVSPATPRRRSSRRVLREHRAQPLTAQTAAAALPIPRCLQLRNRCPSRVRSPELAIRRTSITACATASVTTSASVTPTRVPCPVGRRSSPCEHAVRSKSSREHRAPSSTRVLAPTDFDCSSPNASHATDRINL